MKSAWRARRQLFRSPAVAMLAFVTAFAMSGPVLGKTQTVVRVTAGVHPGFGRLVFDAPGLSYTVGYDAGQVLIRFSDDARLAELPAVPRNVLAIRAVQGGANISVPAGANVHTRRIGTKVVIDIDDPVPDRTPVAPARTPATPKPGPEETSAKPDITRSAASRIPAAPVPAPPAPGPLAPISLAPTPLAPTSLAPAPLAPAARGPTSPARAPLAPAPRASTPPAPVPLAPAPSAPAPRAPIPPAPVPLAPVPLAPAPSAPSPVAPVPSARETATVPTGQFKALTSRPSPAQAAVEVPASQARGPSAPVLPGISSPDQAASAPDAPQPAAKGMEPSPPAATPEVASPVLHGLPETSAAPAADPFATRPAEPSTAQSGSIQVWPVTRDAVPAGPVALVAIKTSPPGGLVGLAVQIPFEGAVAAALFSRGPDTFVVFDERRPIDLSALRDDPVFGSAIVTISPAATVIRMTRSPGQSAMLSPAAAGWRISIVAASPRPAQLATVETADGMSFAAEAPGQVVTITDPRTGGTLLVGTQRISGQAILTERRTPEFILPVTGQGVVVEPLSDAMTLRAIPTGFVLLGMPSGLLLSRQLPMPEATMEAASLTRTFDFPRQATGILARRAKQQAAAAAPPLARGPKRHLLAESMLGLGLGPEAQTLLRVTMKDDPREAASPATIGLAAIAALLAGRPDEAAGLADPRLTGTDEVAMWRAIQTAMADEGSPAAAAVLATTAPLLFTYPSELRARVLPLVMETMILGGEVKAAAHLLAQRRDDPDLRYANALLKQAQGDNEEALKEFDALALSRSTMDYARAPVRGTELRLTQGLLDPKGAADALESRLYAWRGDRRDLALRLRIADLRRRAGDWRGVFATLRGALADFPSHAAEIERQVKDAFAAVPRDPALDRMPATDLIALLDENSELMADGPDGESMRVLLAEKLMALDLPKRADPLLTKLMRAAPPGTARASFGATLATLRLHEGDGDGAMLALSESNFAGMPDAVRERRALITARVESGRGHTSSAVEALAGSHTADADEARASVLEQAKDWPAARDALGVLAAKRVPNSGMLDGAQVGIMLRLATAATRAGDQATLTSLREKLRSRLPAGPQADMFRLLTAEPVRGTADLGRARAEMGLARSITADMGVKKPAKTP